MFKENTVNSWCKCIIIFPLFLCSTAHVAEGKKSVQNFQCCGVNKGLSFKGSWGESRRTFQGNKNDSIILCLWLSLRSMWPSFSSEELKALSLLWCWGGRGRKFGSPVAPGKKGSGVGKVFWDGFISHFPALIWLVVNQFILTRLLCPRRQWPSGLSLSFSAPTTCSYS